jgi:uncharacterized metal-binding protein YceD (DUF177 family)
MSNPATFQPALVTEERPMELIGELPPEMLELQDSVAKAVQPIKIELLVTREGSDLLVNGTLSTTLQVVCGRCAVWMPWAVRTSSEHVLEAPHPASIDLTPSLREDILIELPLNAACRLGADGRCPVTGELYQPPPETTTGSLAGGDVWAALSKIKPKK